VSTLSLHDGSLWRYDLVDRTLTRLTTGGRTEHAVWSADGKRIAVGLATKGTYNLFSVPADGSGEPERLLDGQSNQFPVGWTSDEKSLVFYESADIKLLALDGDRKVRPLLSTKFGERMADLSPDGRWLAYVSNETGQSEVYVQAFPALGSKRRISTEGGIEPAWSRNGRKLVYFAPLPQATGLGGVMMEVDVTLGDRLVVSRPARLFDLPWYAGAIGSRAYDLAADASRFLFVRETYPPAVSAPRHIQLVQNWFEELRRRAPVDAN
jgi:Tol biopolymer transport system component